MKIICVYFLKNINLFQTKFIIKLIYLKLSTLKEI